MLSLVFLCLKISHNIIQYFSLRLYNTVLHYAIFDISAFITSLDNAYNFRILFTDVASITLIYVNVKLLVSH